MTLRRQLAFASVCVSLAACGDGTPVQFTQLDAAAADSADAAEEADASMGYDAPPPLDITSRPDGDLPGTVLVYAHTDTTLYAVNPETRMLQRVGDFRFPSDGNTHAMTDLAVDAMGRVTGVTEDAVYSINPDTAACTLVRALPTATRRVFVGLTWMPVGVLDPSNEVLVGGATDGSLWRINPASGTTSMVATLPSGWGISGDMVSIRGAATYATVRPTTGTSTTDTLVTLTFSGSSVRMTRVGDVGFRSIYGLGYWRQTLYGFTRAGELIAIGAANGRGTLVSMPPMTAFSGAGVTTIASTAPP